MSKYTTEVRFICEQAAGLTSGGGYSSIDKTIDAAIDWVFDFDFPIFDERYKNVLCKKILRHYYTREIGLETVGLWKHFMCMRLNEIMPYYNKLYLSEKIELDPFEQVSMTTRHIKDNIGATDTSKNSKDKTGSSFENNTNVDGTQINRDLYSDTPQGALDNLENETYLTNARKNIATSDIHTVENGSSSYDADRTENHATNISSTEEYIQEISGKNGSVSPSKLLKEYRDTFINIDMQIIGDLSDLFMNLW